MRAACRWVFVCTRAKVQHCGVVVGRMDKVLEGADTVLHFERIHRIQHVFIVVEILLQHFSQPRPRSINCARNYSTIEYSIQPFSR